MMDTEKTVRFHPLAPELTVSGSVLQKWEALGGPEGALGFPTWPETRFKSGAATQRFQRGYIAFHPETGAHAVTGKILLWWQDQLGVYGRYGYPTGDPRDEGGATVQAFQWGEIRSDSPEIAGGIDLRGEIARRGIAIRNQGARGTCSVQVMVFLLEYLYAGLLGCDYAHLSVEYSNHFANVATGDREDGHCFDAMEAAYNEYGIVKESVWPYNKDWTYGYDQAQASLPQNAIAEGRRMLADGLRLQGRFVKPLDGMVGLTAAQFDEMIALLDAGIPVGVGRGHSLAAVGYRRDAALPGGGYIVFRNSYGTSPDFTGYQTETFENVMRTVNDLYVYTLV